MDGGRRSKCNTTWCYYYANDDYEAFQGYCCHSCSWYHKWTREDTPLKHGPRCQKRRWDDGDEEDSSVQLTPNRQSEAPIRQHLTLQEGKHAKKARTAQGGAEGRDPVIAHAGELFYEKYVDDGRSKIAKWYEDSWKYIDPDTGTEQNYLLHLPDSCTVESLQQENGNWPLLVFLHGKGSGSYFEYATKKTQHEPGLLATAERMLVLSPRCDWTWVDQPTKWVEALIKSFTHLPGIDRRRIYMTGYSMGGMSCWELLGRLPEGTFAAAAPAGAYCPPWEYEERWIDRMVKVAEHAMSGGTSIRVYHGAKDERCDIRVQEKLWNRIQDRCQRFGNGLFKSQVLRGDHSDAFEEMYYKNTDFCDMLLDLSLEA
mmetsp:Transcript_53816/g.99479  ORF Transcript_53816/g.99479 Transcript_53816/m.99479 type:complete len:371 (+) Transcript_53816:39-1151(+)